MATLYETPRAATPAGDSVREEERFSVANPPQSTFTLGYTPATDLDGDPIIDVHLNGVLMTRGTDYQLAGAVITWGGGVALDAGEELRVSYLPMPSP